MATIRLIYPKISAVAGPCGLLAGRPRTRDQQQELPRKQIVLQFRMRLSAQHGRDDRQSADLVQPRSETPAYTIRRSKPSRNTARAPAPRPSIPRPNEPNLAIQANDQLRPPKRPTNRRTPRRARGRSYRSRATRICAGFCETVETAPRYSRQVKTAASTRLISRFNGRDDSRHRGLSYGADPECDHSGGPKAATISWGGLDQLASVCDPGTGLS